MKTEHFKIFWRYIVKKKKHQTDCTIVNLNDNFIVGKGSTLCSKKDQFQKDIGRKISLSRALSQGDKAYSLTKEQHAEIWEGYRLMVPGGRW